VSAYFDVQTTRAAWLARQQTEELAQTTLDISTRRQNQGVGAPSDTLQAATALAKARLERSRAKGAYDKAQAVLMNLAGLNHRTGLSVQEAASGAPMGATTPLMSDLKSDLDLWLERATNHPSVLAARAQLSAAQEKIKSAEAEGFPTLDFSTNYYDNGRPGQGLSSTKTQQTLASVTLNIPLFEGFGRTYKVRGAQALAEQRSAELQDSERQILLEVVRTHADALAALDNLEASHDLQRWAQEAAASVQRRYERGVSDILEMITAQAALADARQERIRALSEWQSARLKLLASSGVIGRESVGMR
jgi:outer membrane protein